MKQMRITYILMAVAALLVVSCSSHDDDSVPMQTVTMPIKLAIPAEGFGTPTRAAGDPGTFERFELPRYLYIFLESIYIDANNNKEKTIIYKEIDLGDQEKNPMWVKVKVKDGSTSVYTYTGNLSIDLPLQRTSGKVYVAASVQRLANTESKKTEYLYFKNGDNYESSLNGTANSSTNIPVETKFVMETNKQLHNLYSTPYNLANANGEYYGTLKDYASKVPSINLILYHVAAKIDVSWSVDESIQNKVKLVAFQARDLQEYDAYLFKPLQKTYNESSSNLFGKQEGYNVWLINNTATPSGSNYVFGDDVIGLQWFGRGYFYALLGKATDNNYYIKMLVQNQAKYKSDNTKGHYFLIEISKDKVKGTKNIGIDGEPVFTPWVRATVRVKSVFDYNNETDVPIPPSSTSTNAIESQSQIIE